MHLDSFSLKNIFFCFKVSKLNFNLNFKSCLIKDLSTDQKKGRNFQYFQKYWKIELSFQSCIKRNWLNQTIFEAIKNFSDSDHSILSWPFFLAHLNTILLRMKVQHKRNWKSFSLLWIYNKNPRKNLRSFFISVWTFWIFNISQTFFLFNFS